MTEEEFEQYLTPLRPKQKEFLRRRRLGLTDTAASDGLCSRRAIANWKKEPRFQKRYDVALGLLQNIPALKRVEEIVGTPSQSEGVSEDSVEALIAAEETSLVLYDEAVIQAALARLPQGVTLDEAVQLAQQYDYMQKFLPLVIQRHLALLLKPETSVRELVQLLKLYYELIGFSPERRLPGGQRSQVLVNTLYLLAPQIAAQAEARGLDVPRVIKDVIDAEFRVVSDYGNPYGLETEASKNGIQD